MFFRKKQHESLPIWLEKEFLVINIKTNGIISKSIYSERMDWSSDNFIFWGLQTVIWMRMVS